MLHSSRESVYDNNEYRSFVRKAPVPFVAYGEGGPFCRYPRQKTFSPVIRAMREYCTERKNTYFIEVTHFDTGIALVLPAQEFLFQRI